MTLTVPPLLEASGLSFSIEGRELFSGLDLTVAPGERVGVFGPSGSGKTSLLALLAGLAVPTAGTVTVEGNRVGWGVPNGVAVVLQGYGLLALLTAAENVEVALRLAGVAAASRDERTVAALDMVRLGEFAGHLVEELSGGQQQRVAVARALAVRPRLLVADEPTAEQDPDTRGLVLERLLSVSEGGGAVVVATHDPRVAERCTRTLTLG